MKATSIPFSDTKSFSNLMQDYLSEKAEVAEFINHFPSLENIAKAASERKFSRLQRDLLVESIKKQYQNAAIKLKVGSPVAEQIERLASEKTFTITTGHQLCLMGGPLYFLYKIVSTVKLSNELNKKNPALHFVPVFWMASEDHDFEEIDHFRFKGKKYQWKRESGGAVGRLNTEGLKEIFEELKEDLPNYSGNANHILSLFEKSYLKYEKLADASRAFVHEIFANQGVVIIDGDDFELKRSFLPIMQEELKNQPVQPAVEEQSKNLGQHYKLQVNPRKINLFYLSENNRERIEEIDSGFQLVESEKKFSKKELFDDLEKHPDRFSPNVLMRPIYQELILPNLAYIGGGGEMAYWFQLKKAFEHFNIDFPLLILRNSCLYINQKQKENMNSLGLEVPKLFEREGDLIKQWVVEQENINLLLEDEKKSFQELWKKLESKSLGEDASLGPFVEAESKHLSNWLDRLSDKLIRSQRRKEDTAVQNIKKLKSELFPSGSLQERYESMLELLMLKGDELLPELMEHFEIPTDQFLILELNN